MAQQDSKVGTWIALITLFFSFVSSSLYPAKTSFHWSRYNHAIGEGRWLGSTDVTITNSDCLRHTDRAWFVAHVGGATSVEVECSCPFTRWDMASGKVMVDVGPIARGGSVVATVRAYYDEVPATNPFWKGAPFVTTAKTAHGPMPCEATKCWSSVPSECGWSYSFL